jgi:GWxTD domain-containing protein
MTTLTQFWQQPITHAMGWTLLHFCWQGALVAIVLWCVLGLLSRRSSQLRYAASCLALLTMVILPIVTFTHLSAEARATQLQLPALTIDLSVTADGGSATTIPWKERIAALLEDATPWILGVWLAGVGVFLARLNLGLIVTQKIKSDGTETAPPELQQLFRDLTDRLGITRAVKLLHSSRVEVPTVIGWLRPIILMPVGCMAGLSTAQVEALFAHELAHIRRHDYLVSVFQSVIEALLFYHPAVWWVSQQVRRERECCCDDLAVQVGGDALEYAKALSWLEARRTLYPEVALGANGGVLTMRIKRLLGYAGSSAGSQLAAATVLLGVAASAVICGSTTARAQLAAAARMVPVVRLALPAPQTVETIAPAVMDAKLVAPPIPGISGIKPMPQAGEGTSRLTHYTIWLDQDVLWIITPAERTAFLNLTNDNERDNFIESFWARRNPSGGPDNSYRDEHYQRIAYSNEHFATANIPGWKTDRGHIYIAYGKPESIDSHPTGGQFHGASANYPFEVWHYRSIEGIGDNVDIDFVDTCNCGQYHYTIDHPGMVNLQTNPPDRLSRAAKLLAPPAPAVAPAEPATPNIREINYRGLNSITISDVAERLKRSNLEIHLETPYDPTQIAQAAAALKQLLAEHGHASATVTPIIKTMPPASVGITFDVKEGPKAMLSQVAYKLSSAPPQPSAPQGGAGAIAGIVMDKTGAVIAHAKVSATNTETGNQVARETDGAGSYSIAPLPAGNYNVQVAAPGFSRQLQKNVQVIASAKVGLNLRLRVGESTMTLTVKGTPLPPTTTPEEQVPDNTAKPGGPQHVSAGAVMGMIISRPDPVYPPEARAAHIQGEVVLHALISKDGVTENVYAISGPPELIGCSIDAVRQWKYKPYLLDGEPTEVETTITVNYSLAEGGGAAYKAGPHPDTQAELDRAMVAKQALQKAVEQELQETEKAMRRQQAN